MHHWLLLQPKVHQIKGDEHNEIGSPSFSLY
jgi:hypothetical protein